jgi:hypothetical protein
LVCVEPAFVELLVNNQFNAVRTGLEAIKSRVEELNRSIEHNMIVGNKFSRFVYSKLSFLQELAERMTTVCAKIFDNNDENTARE